MPRVLVHATVRKNLFVSVEVELALHEPIGEFSRFDSERADIARQLLAFLLHPAAKDHLEDAVTGGSLRAEDQGHEVGVDSNRR